MRPLVFLEHDGAAVSSGSLGVLSKVTTLGDPVAAALIGGPEVSALVATAGAYGAQTVHLVADPSFAAPLPGPRVDALAALVEAGGYDTVLFANSVLSGDVAGALAARLDAGLNWDLVDLAVRDGELVGVRPAIGDSVFVEVGWRGGPRLALFRAGSFEAVPVGSGEPSVEVTLLTPAPHSLAAQLVERRRAESSGPSLEDAEVIVAGGMGLGGPEHFALAEELAEVLGGVVGATRAAVYAGWYPYSAQVGQTGKTVAPKLYVALGISGAVQHKVGMQNAKTIVAINTDPGAPIFELSDLAVVGDVHAIVPELIELVRQRKAHP